MVALDTASGRILWEQTAWEGTPYDTRHRRGSFAAPTPVTDGTLVYAYFGAEGLYTYDFQGHLKWSWKTGGIASFGVGVGTSPVLYGEHRHRAVRRGQRREVLHRRARPQDGQGGLAHRRAI